MLDLNSINKLATKVECSQKELFDSNQEVFKKLIVQFGHVLEFTEISMRGLKSKNEKWDNYECYHDEKGEIKKGILIASKIAKGHSYENHGFEEEVIEIFLLEDGTLKKFLNCSFYAYPMPQGEGSMERAELKSPTVSEIDIDKVILKIKQHLQEKFIELDKKKATNMKIIDSLKGSMNP